MGYSKPKLHREFAFRDQIRSERKAMYQARYMRLELQCCVYCGGKADVFDHVPPLSAVHLFPDEFPMREVSCCKYCNLALETLPLVCLVQRGRWIASRFYSGEYQTKHVLEQKRNRNIMLRLPELAGVCGCYCCTRAG